MLFHKNCRTWLKKRNVSYSLFVAILWWKWTCWRRSLAIDDSVLGYEGIDILMYATGGLDMTGNIVLQQFYPWFSDMSASQLSASPFQNTVENDSNTGLFPIHKAFEITNTSTSKNSVVLSI